MFNLSFNLSSRALRLSSMSEPLSRVDLSNRAPGFDVHNESRAAAGPWREREREILQFSDSNLTAINGEDVQ